MIVVVMVVVGGRNDRLYHRVQCCLVTSNRREGQLKYLLMLYNSPITMQRQAGHKAEYVTNWTNKNNLKPLCSR